MGYGERREREGEEMEWKRERGRAATKGERPGLLEEEVTIREEREKR